MRETELCPCHSEKNYTECCMPFHKGIALPANAVLLMRARYSAFALHLPDYIMNTTHPASPQYMENRFSWRYSISTFSKNSIFQGLEILDHKEKGRLATVTFTAKISQKNTDATFTEKSRFEKKNEQWLYLGGQLEEGHAPNLATIGQFRVLPLAYYGDAILRRKGDPVDLITSDLITLVEEMIETMDAFDGIGLAAPQIHHSIRLFVIRKPTEDRAKEIELGPVKVFINPTLSEYSEETWKAPEGCLSIPTIRAAVERPKEITVEYTNLEGKQIRERVSGWEARVIMHEYDHIEGILFIDRLSPKEQEALHSSLENIKQRIHDGKAL